MIEYESSAEKPVVELQVSIRIMVNRAALYTLSHLALATLISVVVAILSGSVQIT